MLYMHLCISSRTCVQIEGCTQNVTVCQHCCPQITTTHTTKTCCLRHLHKSIPAKTTAYLHKRDAQPICVPICNSLQCASAVHCPHEIKLMSSGRDMQTDRQTDRQTYREVLTRPQYLL